MIGSGTDKLRKLILDTSPHKSEFVNVNGIRLHYLDWGGNGTVLLFLTGMGNSAHIYDKFAPRFIDKFHVIALTRRGHGDSDYTETGYDVDTLTEDVRQFMDSGDSAFSPMKVPHTWAFVAGTQGKMLFVVSPIGKLEAFFADAWKRNAVPSADQNHWQPYGLEWVGPPLTIN